MADDLLPARPRGTVTFLFTDIEGSTRLWEQDRAAMSAALERHDRILHDSVADAGGVVFSTGGDGLAAAFARAPDALAAAVAAQRRLQAEPSDPPLAVRMGVHSGDVEERDGDYFGPPLNRCARLMAAGHGGQILCSAVTRSLSGDQLPDDCTLRGLGRHRLRDLSDPEEVFQVEHTGLRSDFPPLRSLDTYRGNLPTQSTTFVGREREVVAVAKALAEARVVTLCGVGGVGKTRLALQVAAHALPQYPDGAWLVELASVGTGDAAVEAVAGALGVQAGPGRTTEQSLLDYLRAKTLLLIVDNCEHLLHPVSTLVEAAVQAAPGLTVLATSREGLAVAGERLLTVPSLETPDPATALDDLLVTEAVRLFTQRAQETRADLELTAGDAQAVGELCRRLDGIPLAIELAAARMRVMSPKEILEHLDRRFKLLTGGRRTAVTRHQTLRSTLDWSHDLLEDGERRVFRRLSVFAGAFDLTAAEAVAGDDELEAFDVAELLFKLVEKSLVLAVPGAEGTRYRLLETIRDYGWERLVDSGEAHDVAGRHAHYYLRLAEETGPGLCGADEVATRDRIELELDNFRAALRWAVDADDTDTALRLVDAFSQVGSLSPPFGLVALEVARMDGAAGHPLTAVALAAAAATMSAAGDHQRIGQLVDEALEAASAARASPLGVHALCRTVSNVCMVAYIQSDLPRFIGVARDWLAAAGELDDHFELSQAQNLLGAIVADDDEGVELCESAVSLARRLGSPSRMAYACIALGSRLSTMDVDRAERVLTEGLEAARRARSEWVDSYAAQQLATLQARKGDVTGAVATLVDTAERGERTGDRFATNLTLGYLALMLALLGEEEAALVVGTWAEQGLGWGYDPTHPSFADVSLPYEELRKKQSDGDRRRLAEVAANLDTLSAIALARDALERRSAG